VAVKIKGGGWGWAPPPPEPSEQEKKAAAAKRAKHERLRVRERQAEREEADKRRAELHREQQRRRAEHNSGPVVPHETSDIVPVIGWRRPRSSDAERRRKPVQMDPEQVERRRESAAHAHARRLSRAAANRGEKGKVRELAERFAPAKAPGEPRHLEPWTAPAPEWRPLSAPGADRRLLFGDAGLLAKTRRRVDEPPRAEACSRPHQERDLVPAAVPKVPTMHAPLAFFPFGE